MRFVLLIGVVSLFADMSYEGARSITGPFLAFLGASAFVTGVVAGVGEFVGYGLRIVFGYLSDRTGRYWPITLWGYGLAPCRPGLDQGSLQSVVHYLVLPEPSLLVYSGACGAVLVGVLVDAAVHLVHRLVWLLARDSLLAELLFLFTVDVGENLLSVAVVLDDHADRLLYQLLTET